jgi:NAD(P)-dependent dehydrogenase (short-subunit alcohol dehydrogenase family)|tara:strand:- start:1092 stop:1883 length:792 start_codon:yes stop_codon:yes gene_type:complete
MDVSKLFNLKNKTAYVLGGSGTIGSSLCLALAQCKAKVIVLDIKKNSKFKSKNISFYNFDIKKISTFENKLKFLFNKIGKPDIFINCSYPHTNNWSNTSFSNLTIKSIQNNINLQLNSSIWITRLFAEQMKKNKINGAILSLGSIYGVVAQDEDLYKNSNINLNSIYSAIKNGLVGYTKQLASYYGKHKIRINVLSPGGIKGNIAGNKQSQQKSFIKKYSKKVPLKRMATVEDIVPMAIFLVTDGSSYITGTNILVDGGLTII